jgi:hypothetical protein
MELFLEINFNTNFTLPSFSKSETMRFPDEDRISLISDCISTEFLPDNYEIRLRYLEDINYWYEGDQLIYSIQEFGRLYYSFLANVIIQYYQSISQKNIKMNDLKQELGRFYDNIMETKLQDLNNKFNEIRSFQKTHEVDNKYFLNIINNYSETIEILNNKDETVKRLQVIFSKFSDQDDTCLCNFLKEYSRSKSKFKEYLNNDFPFIEKPKFK